MAERRMRWLAVGSVGLVLLVVAVWLVAPSRRSPESVEPVPIPAPEAAPPVVAR